MVGTRKIRLTVLATSIALVLAVLLPIGIGKVWASEGPVYYLALGDSLAQGVQPDATGQSVVTSSGYVDDLYALMRRVVPGLQLAKLGCPGETSTSMVSGGKCSYPDGSQLLQGEDFLAHHRVAFVTLDIGANDVDGCVSGGQLVPGCVPAGLASVGTNLPVIVAGLKAAAGGVPVVGMNYYDPFLAAWLSGAAGQALAGQSLYLSQQFNSELGQIYAGAGDRVADVAAAFLTYDTTPLPLTGTPVDVAVICTLTWMCAPSPVGPNIHANAAGYAVIASTFVHPVLDGLSGGQERAGAVPLRSFLPFRSGAFELEVFRGPRGNN